MALNDVLNKFIGNLEKKRNCKIRFAGFTRIKLYAPSLSTEIKIWSAMQNAKVKY